MGAIHQESNQTQIPLMLFKPFPPNLYNSANGAPSTTVIVGYCVPLAPLNFHPKAVSNLPGSINYLISCPRPHLRPKSTQIQHDANKPCQVSVPLGRESTFRWPYTGNWHSKDYAIRPFRGVTAHENYQVLSPVGW